LLTQIIFAVLIGVFVSTSELLAQGTYSLQPTVIGSSDTADAEPPVIRPATHPCKVQLFSGYQFTDYAPQSFSFVPPEDCSGPWSKIVFVGDFSVNGTNQYDRTAEIQVNDVTIYYGTTPEPTPTVQPSWHVESDLTDYAAVFRTAQQGTVELGNTVSAGFNGVQTGSAYLEFYPADLRNPPPRTADQVLPLPDLQQNPGAQKLRTGSDTVSQVLTLPPNIEAAYLDVFTQGQNEDEVWWLSNPSFREAVITLDGRPAGLAPLYPYLYTGTLDPALWRPIPGVQTLNLKPYRVDLTPFVGILDDGQPHTISLSVYNAHDYINADAVLLVFQDHGAPQTTGELLSDNLTGVTAPVVERDTVNQDITVTTNYAQSYKIRGYVNTSHGHIETEVESSVTFSNVNAATPTFSQISQLTTATRKSTTNNGLLQTVHEDTLTFPLVFKTSGETLSFDQKLTEQKKITVGGFPVYESQLLDDVAPVVTITSDSAAESVTSSETYHFRDTDGRCWKRQVSAVDGAVSAVQDGLGCAGDVNVWHE